MILAILLMSKSLKWKMNLRDYKMKATILIVLIIRCSYKFKM